ncbi:MAG: SDR family oxidoreductase [Actinomycetota bacterium]|nr:SDR family oxidoreductase [Actinomycetota bacterium]
MDLGLRDRVYIVTGGTAGLGLATARTLVADGAKVVVSSRNQESVDRAVNELGENALGVVADNADVTTPDRLVAAALDTFGRLDGALISVGGPAAGGTMDTTEDQWRAAVDSVLLGSVRLARTVAAALGGVELGGVELGGVELGGGGSIAFVLSTSVKAPIPGLAISNALRPGLAMFAKTMADELGPQGIRVNGLLPGRIDTDRVRWLDDQSADPAATRRKHESTIPLRRYGTPDEFGAAAAFLLSPAAGFLTGVMLPVDGGLTRSL